MWIITCLTLSGPVFISTVYDIIGRNIFLNSLFLGFIRNLWGISIAWIILACCRGEGGFVNKLLSSKYWMPIGKLGLSLYLVHPVFQYNLISSREHPMVLDTGVMVISTLFHVSQCVITFFFKFHSF
jgi:peptidoglycan/LPS O-acetylase OafA/YrhL